MPIRNLPFALAVIASLWVSSSFAAEPTDESPQKFIQSWAEAFNTNDPEKLSAFYDPSEELEVIVSAGVRHHGYKALKQAYVGDSRNVYFYDSQVSNLSTRVLGETALVTFEHQFKVRFKTDNTRWQVHIQTTTVLHRTQGEWKIVLEHSSPIEGTSRFIQIQK